MKSEHGRDVRMRYVINRCHVCGAAISDANRNRLTDRVCDGCMWNLELTGATNLLQLGNSQRTIVIID